jgi:hypothetical protein
MAEERTVSNFTWLTPPLRSKLAVASMARMTQIRQYYASEKHHSVCILIFFVSFLTLPLQLRKKSHPRIKYFEAKARNKHSPFREQEITEPAVDDTLWPTESGQGEALAEKKLDLTARTTSLLNLDSSWLADVLSEKPTSEDQKGRASGPQLQSAKVVLPQVSNNNFSLLF